MTFSLHWIHLQLTLQLRDHRIVFLLADFSKIETKMKHQTDRQMTVKQKINITHKKAPISGQNTATIMGLVADKNTDEQSKLLNYIALADNHLNNNVQNLILPLNGKMKYEKKSYDLNSTQFDQGKLK